NASAFPYWTIPNGFVINRVILLIPAGWELYQYDSGLVPVNNTVFRASQPGVWNATYRHTYSMFVEIIRESNGFTENITTSLIAFLCDNISINVKPFYNGMPVANGNVTMTMTNGSGVVYSAVSQIDNNWSNFTINLNNTLQHNGKCNVFLLWTNGTGVGRYAFTLNIFANTSITFLPENSSLISDGVTDIIAKYIYEPLPPETQYPTDVILLDIESNVSTLCYDLSYSAPYLEIRIFVAGIEDGIYFVHMLIGTTDDPYSGAELYEEQWANFTFNISGVLPSNITILSGATYDAESNMWVAHPQPYVNDSTAIKLFYYNVLSGGGLLYAVVFSEVPPELANTGLAHPLLQSLYNGSPSTLGMYNLIINTTGIHSNINYTVNYTIVRAGYVGVTIRLRVCPTPLPLRVTTIVPLIESYVNTTYEFGITITDIRERILQGDILGNKINVTWSLLINGSENSTFGKFEPFMTTWKTTIPLSAVGNHTLSILVVSEDCETTTQNVSVRVLDKINVIVHLDMISEVMEGSQLPLEIWLSFDNSSPASNIPIRVRVKIGLNEYVLSTSSDENGRAFVIFNVPTGIAPFDARGVEFLIEVEIVSTVPAIRGGVCYTTMSYIISPNTIIFRNLWLITAVAVGAISGTVSYQRFYRMPRIRKQLERESRLERLFLDIIGLKYVIILEKGTGISLVEYAIDKKEIDSQLIGGFISAISSFGEELSGKSGIAGIEYKNFYLAVADGERIRVIFALSERPSNEFNERALNLVKEFEMQYRNELDSFSGNIDPFRSAVSLIENTMEIWMIRNVELVNSRVKKVAKDVVKSARLLAGEIQIFRPSNLIKNASSIGKRMGYVVSEVMKMKKLNAIKPLSQEEFISRIQGEMNKIKEMREKMIKDSNEGRLEKEKAQKEVALLRAKLETLISLVS
ncbi:MAG: hypothetical protein QXL15_01535, partial [Candidatus Korarchaeota archaeon]